MIDNLIMKRSVTMVTNVTKPVGLLPWMETFHWKVIMMLNDVGFRSLSHQVTTRIELYNDTKMTIDIDKEKNKESTKG